MKRLRKWQNRRQIIPLIQTTTNKASILLESFPFSSTLAIRSSLISRKTSQTVLITLLFAVVPCCTCATADLDVINSTKIMLTHQHQDETFLLHHHAWTMRRSLDETTRDVNAASDSRSPVRIFFGYFLVAIGGISLVGWAYIFYLRISYSRKLKEEEEQQLEEGHGFVASSNNKCCKGNGMGVVPVEEAESPSRSQRSEGVVKYGPYYDHVESRPMHHDPRQQNQNPRQSPKHNMKIHKKEEMIRFEDKSSNGKIRDRDDDSFARELQIATRVDRHIWVEHESRKKAVDQKQRQQQQQQQQQQTKVPPSLHPSESSTPYFSGIQGFDFWGWKQGWGGETGNTASQNGYDPQSPKVSYLPTRLQSRPREDLQTRPGSINNQNFDNNHRSNYRSVRGDEFRDYPHHLEMNDSDPSDVILSDSSSANYSSAASNSSYAGKQSSVEEGEHDGEEDGFELIGYLKGRNDGMNEYLLNPIPASDDTSFGNGSGMEMSLGAATTNTNQTGSSHGRGSERRGFYVLKEDYDLIHEYIPKEEYDAAVMAVTEVLKNSPRNSPRNSPQRARQDTMQMSRGGCLTKSYQSAPSDERNSSLRSESNSVSDYESTSINPYNTQTSLDSSTTESESKLSKDIFNELRNVSAFIRKYEKKKSFKRTHHRTQNYDNGYDTIDSSNDTNTFTSSNSQPSMTVTSVSETDSAFQGDKKQRVRMPTFGKKKKKDRVVENEVEDFEVNVKSKKKRSKKNKSKMRVFPPRYPGHKKIGDSDREEYDDGDDDDDDVIIVANSLVHGSKLPRRQLPVAGNGQYPDIGMNPSGDSSASDANFLRNEIESFFSQKDTSMSVMSESIEVLHVPNSANSNSAPKNTPTGRSPLAQKTPIQLPISSERPSAGDSGRLGAAPFDPSDSPKLLLNQFEKKAAETPPPSTVRVKEKVKSLTPLASSKKDTLPVYGNTVHSPHSSSKYETSIPPPIPLAQSAKTMFQSGARSIASMIDRTRQTSKEENGPSQHQRQDIQSGVATSVNKTPNEQRTGTSTTRQQSKNASFAGLETRLQYGARSLLYMFEAKEEKDDSVPPKPSSSPQKSAEENNTGTGTLSNRLEQIRRSVKYRAVSSNNKTNNTNTSSSSPKSLSHNVNRGKNEQTPKDSQVVYDEEQPTVSRKVQVATFVSPLEHEQVISPASTHGIRNAHQRTPPGKLYRPDLMSISQQSGDDTTESPVRTNRDFTHMNMTSSSSSPPNMISAHSRFSPGNHHRDANNNSGSTVGSTTSNTKNLISIFESRRASTNGIFPPGEHWQYTGKLKPQRNTFAR
eukprot:CAMPEP_0176502876 /NCGR_PEP_ID=MMETSP0200_2-20121128/15018_1 /TAXON_ID=947934 /ORGANISM="Chaetoceros sp., Strain GSL56" /LENGTH=1300 /DNA_ID=CAMNT_0017902039 /DNA_START=41 /DNA_END=3943 /DNA_ORIENTATION=+